MRFTRTLALAALTATAATQTAAFDLTAMTETERSAFQAEVRAYLLDNPEVLMEAIGVLENRQQVAEAERDTQMVAANLTALHNDAFAYVGGNPDGDVTVVEFVDYRCGYCRRAHPAVAELVESDGNIRIITIEFPILGDQSRLASQFAIATKQVAGDAAYKQVSDALMTLRSDVTEDSLTALANAFDLDAAAILAEMDSDATAQVLANNRSLGDRLQITGTPTFVFGDQLVRGFVELPGMRAIVAKLRADEAAADNQ